ncbi:hypothetical protein [Pseudonocardia sp. NPDC049635]|uniref:hypothetical protein n=1 Tax=Pseudonocardia sp. NPDC049635 TaxID=3155506 RepID=UPI0033D3B01F
MTTMSPWLRHTATFLTGAAVSAALCLGVIAPALQETPTPPSDVAAYIDEVQDVMQSQWPSRELVAMGEIACGMKGTHTQQQQLDAVSDAYPSLGRTEVVTVQVTAFGRLCPDRP